ncbi:DUF3231 family protein [Desulfolucanica intricata]|uniref:DUF3231 family protein n=1 Tax=Desulfolucanica intricata TaxID=1285191 RepID=UPI0008299C33|nr:DUF3231 family protein [Desulfolucanica intricata]
MLTKIIEEIEKITNIGKSPSEKQKEINVTEASLIWDLLTTRYDTLETNKVFENWAGDSDLKIILEQGDKFISKEIEILENITIEYGIPSPPRTTVNPVNIINKEVLSDKYIYRHTLGGIQAFLPTLVYGITHTISPTIRNIFIEFLTQEIKLYSNFFEYGLLKGYLATPPAYRM